MIEIHKIYNYINKIVIQVHLYHNALKYHIHNHIHNLIHYGKNSIIISYIYPGSSIIHMHNLNHSCIMISSIEQSPPSQHIQISINLYIHPHSNIFLIIYSSYYNNNIPPYLYTCGLLNQDYVDINN